MPRGGAETLQPKPTKGMIEMGRVIAEARVIRGDGAAAGRLNVAGAGGVSIIEGTLPRVATGQEQTNTLVGDSTGQTLGEVSGVVLNAPSRNVDHFSQTARSGSKTCDSPCRVC